MIIAMVLIPIFEVKWEKRSSEKYEKKRQKRYKEYLMKKNTLIENIKEEQKKILYKKDISAEQCSKVVANKSHRLWERRISDPDFLTVRLGIGQVSLQVELSYPEEYFLKIFSSSDFCNNDFVHNYQLGPYKLDFAWVDSKLDIEVDGDQHYRFNNRIESDIKRDQYCEDKGWTVIRIKWSDFDRLNKEERIEFINNLNKTVSDIIK